MIENLPLLVYIIGAFWALTYGISLIWELLKKKRTWEDRYLTEKQFAAATFLVAFLTAFSGWQCVTAPVPEGEYSVKVGVLPMEEDMYPMMMDADIRVRRDVDYQDYDTTWGIMDSTGTHVYVTEYVFLDAVYSKDGEVLFQLDEPIETGGPVRVSTDYGDLRLELPTISKETFGISGWDIWENQSISSKACDIAPILCCALLVLQHMKYLKSKD